MRYTAYFKRESSVEIEADSLQDAWLKAKCLSKDQVEAGDIAGYYLNMIAGDEGTYSEDDGISN